MSNSKFIDTLRSSSLKNIIKWTKGSRHYILLISIGNVVFTGLSLWLALMSKAVVDAAVSKNKPELISNSVTILVIILAQLLIWYLVTRSRSLAHAKFVVNMRRMTLERIMEKQYADIEKYHSGELVNRMFSDVSVVSEGVIGIVPPVLSMLTQLIGAFTILVRINAKFVFVLVVVAFLAFVVTMFFRKTSKRLHKNVQEKEGEVHAVLQESLQNIRLIKASESEERITNTADSKQSAYYKALAKRINFYTFASAGLHFVFRMSWLYAMLWGAFGIFAGSITYGTLTAILQLVGQIQSPFANMSGLLSKLYSTLSSAERLQEIHDLPSEKKSKSNIASANELYNKLNDISIENMTFSYGRSTENVLSDVNFKINRGDFAAVTGLSGGGKSTLFLLMLGIYEPTVGNVTFDIDGEKLTAGADTRKLFSYVPQGNALFSGTLRENVSMFRESATEDEINEAIKIACIDDFVEKLPDGLDTVIGERGLGLSEGQAQRIAVARAILGNAPILLLDEATSALDEKTEAQLLKNISELKNRTCFIVTHRKAALSICNKRLLLDGGKITTEDI